MNRIIYPNDFDKSTLKKYATNIPLLDKFINNYITNNPNNELVFKINSESRKDNEISFWFQLEHTLVLNGGRDMKGAKPGIVKSIYNDDKYNVRIDNHNSFHKFNIIVEYRVNVHTLDDSNLIYSKSVNFDINHPVGVRFADTYTGLVPATFRFRLPVDSKSIIRMHKDFRSENSVYNQLLTRNAKNVTIITATQYTGEEFFQGGLNRYKQQLSDQLKNGTLFMKKQLKRII